MKKKAALLLLFIFSVQFIFAQEELYRQLDSLNNIIRYYQKTRDNLVHSYKNCEICFTKPNLEIKYDLGSHLEMYSATQVSFEHSLPIKGAFGKLFRLQHSVGFISDDVGLITMFNKDLIYDRIGFRYRLEPRFYKYRGLHKLSHFFYGPSLMYRYTTIKTLKEFVDPTNSFFIERIVTQHKHTIAFTSGLGWWFRFGKSRICAELNGAIGFNYNIVQDDIPASFTENTFREFNADYFKMDQHVTKPYYSFSGFFSLKLGYIIKKSK